MTQKAGAFYAIGSDGCYVGSSIAEITGLDINSLIAGEDELASLTVSEVEAEIALMLKMAS